MKLSIQNTDCRSTIVTILALTTILLSVSSMVFAADIEGTGGQPGQYLQYGSNVRSLGLGRAYVALPGNAMDVFHNPAGLVDLRYAFDIYVTHYEPYTLSTYNALTLGYLFSDSGKVGSPFLYNSAIAFGALNMRSGDYECRTSNDLYLGDFGMNQSAYAVAFAHRFFHPYAVVDFGISTKLLTEGLSDIAGYDTDAHFTYGFGLQIKPIHPPLIKKIASLRALMPLRIGFAVQNINRPSLGMGESSDEFPRTYRIGIAYQYDRIRQGDILITLDGEKQDWGNRGWSWHGGSEFQFYLNKMCLMPRVGLLSNDDDTNLTFGLGLKYSKWGMHGEFDFAYGTHDELTHDLRVGVRASLGIERNAKQYYNRSQVEDKSRSYSRSMALASMMCYPYANDSVAVKGIEQEILDAAEDLATTWDTVNAERYYAFIGGHRFAVHLTRQAEELLRNCKFAEALKRACEALKHFEDNKGKLDSADYKYWGEALLIVAVTFTPERILASCCPQISGIPNHDDTNAVEKLADSALSKFALAPTSIEKTYMMARCHQLSADWTTARKLYVELHGSNSTSYTIKALSLIGMAVCMEVLPLNVNDLTSILDMITVLDTTLNSYEKSRLSDTYLPYPVYHDTTVADNSQLLIAQLYEKLPAELGHMQDAIRAYARLLKIYQHLDCAVDPKYNVNGRIEELLNKK